jgi:hypothetical protein
MILDERMIYDERGYECKGYIAFKIYIEMVLSGVLEALDKCLE